jgi:glycosyltransferase involved in cell wall biosynthesis
MDQAAAAVAADAVRQHRGCEEPAAKLAELIGLMDQMPTVSACLLTYKRATVLPRTIGDLLGQSFTDFELVINDDCSPDNTREICEAFAAKDPRVRYCRNERNLRYAGNQNAAVERARGKYVAFLHDGDRYSPQLLERWVAAMESCPKATLVFNAVNVLDREGNVSGGYDHGYNPCNPGLEFYDHMLTSIHSPIFGIVMARRDALLAAGPFDVTLPVLADIDMWFRLLSQGDVAYVPERLYSIYPREADHPNARVNWAIRDELARIYRTACDRRHRPDSAEWQRARRTLDRLLLKADSRDMAVSVAKLRWGTAAAGIPHLFRRHALGR